jgi:CrcB protein
MSPLVLAGVGLVGGLGAVLRFLLDGAVSARLGRDFPYGTLAVNLSGTFVLGVLVGLALSGDGYRILGTGLLGAFTTFSTWAFESHRLGEDGELRLGLANIAVSLVLGVGAAWAGRHLGLAL